jgi:hypothetical protein
MITSQQPNEETTPPHKSFKNWTPDLSNIASLREIYQMSEGANPMIMTILRAKRCQLPTPNAKWKAIDYPLSSQPLKDLEFSSIRNP